MQTRFLFWSSLLVASLVGLGLCLRSLAVHQVPVAEGLILRGISCLGLVILMATRQGLSLWPRSLRTQLTRALVAGLALTLISVSYNWLTASAVSMLTNVDVPLLVIFGPLIGSQTSRVAQVLSLISISFLVWYVANIENQTNLLLGLGTLLAGTLLLCLGYLFIKKSMSEENRAVAILTPSLAILFYGLLEKSGDFTISPAWTGTQTLICLLSGIGMFVAYIATMQLYDLTDLASAEFPTLIAAVVIQPAEFLLLGEPMHSAYFSSSVAFVLLTYFILKLQNPALAEVAHGN